MFEKKISKPSPIPTPSLSVTASRQGIPPSGDEGDQRSPRPHLPAKSSVPSSVTSTTPVSAKEVQPPPPVKAVVPTVTISPSIVTLAPAVAKPLSTVSIPLPQVSKSPEVPTKNDVESENEDTPEEQLGISAISPHEQLDSGENTEGDIATKISNVVGDGKSIRSLFHFPVAKPSSKQGDLSSLSNFNVSSVDTIMNTETIKKGKTL